jgi:uncharacterized protein YciI
MTRLFIALLLFLVCAGTHAQSDSPQYNKALADSLGADDYGMKMYVLVILKTGPIKYDDKAKSDSLFRGHMQNIGRLASVGKLIVAGPLQKNEKNYRGIFILNVKTIEEAKLLLETDPAIKAKIFDTEVFQWYGSAALPTYLPFHEKVERKKF